jgi:hypothetical protein
MTLKASNEVRFVAATEGPPGFAFFVMVMTLSAVLPGLLPEAVRGWHWVDGSRLGVGGGVITGRALLSFVTALMQRAFSNSKTCPASLQLLLR